MRLLPSILVLVLLLAGCVGPQTDAPTKDEAGANATMAAAFQAAPTNVSADVGSLVVLVRMPDLTLLAGATVTILDESRTSDEKGEARFAGLPLGQHQVEARKEAHRTAILAVDIRAGEETRAEAVLPAIEGDKHSHEKGIFAHRDLYTFEGHFDCSATYLIITGDCLLVVDTAGAAAGANESTGNATTERNIIDFPLDLDWTTLVVEMAWNATVPTAGTGEEMTLAIEPAEAPADGHAAKYARTHGAAPLRLRLEAGVKHETATADDMPNPLGGEVLRARAYVKGLAHNPGGTDFLGLGAAHDQRFTLLVSIFYEEKPADDYTALPAGA